MGFRSCQSASLMAARARHALWLPPLLGLLPSIQQSSQKPVMLPDDAIHLTFSPGAFVGHYSEQTITFLKEISAVERKSCPNT